MRGSKIPTVVTPAQLDTLIENKKIKYTYDSKQFTEAEMRKYMKGVIHTEQFNITEVDGSTFNKIRNGQQGSPGTCRRER